MTSFRVPDIPDVTPSRETDHVVPNSVQKLSQPRPQKPTAVAPADSGPKLSEKDGVYRGPLTESVLKKYHSQHSSSKAGQEHDQHRLGASRKSPGGHKDDAEGTEYLSPPGGAAYQLPRFNMMSMEDMNGKVGNGGGLTVKDVLGNFADKMRQSLSYSHNQQEQNEHETELQLPLEILEEEDEFNGEEREDNSTLVEDNVPDMDIADRGITDKDIADNSTLPDDNQSRYSVTDYFKKYSSAIAQSYKNMPKVSTSETVPKQAWNANEKRRPKRQENVAMFDSVKTVPDESHNQRKDKRRYSLLSSSLTDDSDNRGKIYESDTSCRISSVTSPLSQSMQEELYRGTELDTSLSSIRETDSVVSSTTISTLSSFDDQAFQEGLANLDANIARVQQALKLTAQQH